jgi:hypothetical protein
VIAFGVAVVLSPPGISLRSAAAAGSAPATEPQELDPADRAALEEAHRLYDEGKAKFDTVDYVGAIDSWTRAYAKTPESAPGVRNAMVYNIATAREKAYEIDGDVQHLRQAIRLLQSYVDSYKALYAKTPETQVEVDKANERIAGLQARIGAAERGETDTGASTDPAAPGTFEHNRSIMWNTGHSPPPDPELVEHNRRLAAEGKKTDAMLIAGYVVGSLGLLFLLGSASAFGVGAAQDRGSDEEDAGRTGKTTGYVGLALGLGAVATGATLIGVGFSRRKKHQRGELSLAPTLAPGYAGGSLTLRF